MKQQKSQNRDAESTSTSTSKETDRVCVDVCDDRDGACTPDNELRPGSELSFSSRDNRNESYCESDISSPGTPPTRDLNNSVTSDEHPGSQVITAS